MNQNTIIQVLSSRKTTLALCIPTIGVNAAHLFKNGSAMIIIITIALLAILTITIITGNMVGVFRKGEKAEPHMLDYFRNAMLVFVLTASLYGIFG